MRKKLILFFIIIISTHFTIAQNVVVEGKIINVNTQNITKIWLNQLVQKKDVAQAQIKNDGSFSLNLNLQYPDFFALKISEKKMVILVLKPGDKVNVIFDATYPSNSQITGSSLTNVLTQAKQIDEQINKQLEDYRKQLQEQQRKEYAKLIEKNLGKASSILLAQQLPLEKYYEVHEKLANSLTPYQNNPYIKQYIESVKAYGLTRIGTTAPDITLPTPQGDTISLSQTRGKYVLVDFWAAWCRPCRVENPNLVKAFDKYHDKGFTIFSVSLDRNRQSWIKAIEEDGLGKWYHVSDLRGWQSQAAKKYGVKGIPSNFLLDPNGKIIGKNLRGEKLQKKLEEIFNQ